jgi:hypothetical protein
VGPTLQHLVQQIALGQQVDVEKYLVVFFSENCNHDIGPCICGARGGARPDQLAIECRRASIMALPDWLQVFRQREKEFEPLEMDE